MSNKIEIYQNNSVSIICVISGLTDITDYTPYITVKSKAEDTIPVIQKSGFVQDPSGTVTFDLAPSDTSINAAKYVYDINIESSANVYTVRKDIFETIDGVKY